MTVSWWGCAGCLIILLCLATFGEKQYCASLYPDKDIVLVRGEPLALNCTADTCDTDVSVHSLWIEMIRGSNGARRIFTNNTTNSDERSVALFIPETTLEDNGTYFCYLNGKMQALKIVNIGEMPEPPRSIHCVSLNWMQMTCYVELSQKKTYLPTNWTMEYRTTESGWSTTLPRQCNKAAYACEWLINDNFSRHEVYDIRVRVTDSLGNASHILRAVEPINIVKPAPVDNFTVAKTETSSVVKLTWKFPKLLSPFFNMTYRISVKAEEGWDNRTLIINNTFTSKNTSYTYEYTLRELIPFAVYSISVSAKPVAAIGDWYWSEPAVVTVRTDFDVPGHSTSLVEGSYYALDCGKYYICPVMYWKNPERRFSHGEIIGYQLNISQIDSLAVESLSSTLEPVSHNAVSREVRGIMGYSEDDLRHIKTMNLTERRVFDALEFKFLKNESYLIKVRAGTEKGFSNAVSELLIPYRNEAEKILPHRVIVEIDNDRHSAVVNWQTTLNMSCEKGLQETVYWCTVGKSQGNQTYALCQDDLDWQRVASSDGCSSSTQTISLPDGKHADDIRFGVSIGVDGVSGGIMWEACRFDAMYDAPDIPMYRVDPVKEKHTELMITVLYEKCYSREGGRPTEYHVVYKPFDGKENDARCPEGANILPFPADFDRPVMYLDNLKSGTRYVVCMRAVNEYHAGSYGKPMVVKTSAPETDDITWIWVTFGIVLPVILLALLILCCVRYLKRRMKLVKIDVPAIPVSTIDADEKKIQVRSVAFKENGNDSGVESISANGSSVNGDKRSSVIDSHSDENDPSVPILAPQISATVRNTKSPSSERKRKISPSLSGYQHFIHVTDDIIYDECETGSLLENDEFENGVDNDLDVERVIVGKITRPKHICVEMEEPEVMVDKILENEFNVEEGNTPEVMIIDQFVHYSANETEALNSEINKIVENGNGNMKTKTNHCMMTLDYVEEDDMHKLSSKNNRGQSSISDKSSHSKMPERKYGEWRAPAEFEKNATNIPLRAFKTGIGSSALEKEDTDIEHKHEIKKREQSKADIALKGGSDLKDVIPFAELHQPPIIDLGDDKESKTTKINDRKLLPNGLKVYQMDLKALESENGLKEEIEIKPQNSGLSSNTESIAVEKMEQRENIVVNEIHDSYAEELESDSDSLSDIAVGGYEDMFYPSVGYGDGELTDVLEAVINYKNKSNCKKLETNGVITNGYIDADQISVGSFVSTASSLQEKSPEKKIVSNQGSKHSSTTTSPMHDTRKNETVFGISETEMNHPTETSENINKSIVEIHTSQVNSACGESTVKAVAEQIQPNNMIDTSKKEKCLENNPNDIIQNISAGNSSGSGISSYVTAGKLGKDNHSKDGLFKFSDKCEEDKSPENKEIHKEREQDTGDAANVVGHSEKDILKTDVGSSKVDGNIELTHL